MFTVAPLTLSVPLAFTSIPLPASIFESFDDFTAMVCASSVIVPLLALSVMSWSLVMVMTLFFVLRNSSSVGQMNQPGRVYTCTFIPQF